MSLRSTAIAGFAIIAVLAACSTGADKTTNRVLIVDKAFDLKTADPHRELTTTGAIIAEALYSTLLTFDDAGSASPAPGVASSYSTSEDATRFTFKLRRDVVFSDGTPLTSADVVFSIQRIVKLKGGPAALLAGVAASAPDANTVVLTSTDPNPDLPFALANPAVAIVNSNAVKGKPDGFLDGTAAGSGPYLLKSFSTFSDVELTANPRYRGPKPFYSRVVIRNMDARTQLEYIASASDEVALDLSPAQAGTLSGNRSVAVNWFTSDDLIFLFTNENPRVSFGTSNVHFQSAVRYALDYNALVQLMGAGAAQATGLIPRGMFGALPDWSLPHRDLEKARAELTASGIKDLRVILGFANDLDVAGLPLSALASMVRAELGEAGITVLLAGSPAAAAMADFAAGNQQMGLWPFASSTDPNAYLAFLPGRQLGLRAGWPAAADPSLESLGMQAGTTADSATRAQLFQHLQGQLLADGPFFPLLQPGRPIVASRGMTGLHFNPTWLIDVAAIAG